MENDYGWHPAAEWRRAGQAGLAVTSLAEWRRQGKAPAARAAAEALLRGADELYLSMATSTGTSTSATTTRSGVGTSTARTPAGCPSSTWSTRATWSGSGVHGFVSQEQWSTLERNGSSVFTHVDVQRLGPAEVAQRAAGIAGERTDCIDVAFGIDVIDTAFAPGPGGVVIGGMGPGQMRAVLEVLRDANVGALDLMEVSPVLDPSGRTMRDAAELLTHFLAPRIFDVAPAGPLAGAGRPR